MTRETSLYVMNSSTPDDAIAANAEAAARQEAHLTCMLADMAPALPMYSYGVPPYGAMNIPDNWSEMLEAAIDRQTARVNEIEAILAKSNVSGDVQAVLCNTTDAKFHIARRARVSDVAHFADNLRETPNMLRELAQGILFNSPIGMMLNGTPFSAIERVFVAWDDSEAASKSVHLALPYLKSAKEVVIGCFDPAMSEYLDGEDPGTSLASWLSHHGCNVTVSQFPSGGKEIGQAIQNRAKETGADLVVMGAYGHARLVQAVFGGTTRTMIEQTDLPVFLAH